MPKCDYCDRAAYNWGKDEHLCFEHLSARLLINMLNRRGLIVNGVNAKMLINQYPRLKYIENDLDRLIEEMLTAPPF